MINKNESITLGVKLDQFLIIILIESILVIINKINLIIYII